MSEGYIDRRQVLSATGAVIVGGLWTSATAAADSYDRAYETRLSPENVEPTPRTNAGGVATVHVADGTAHVEIRVDCLRDGREVRLLCNGREVESVGLTGAVADGIVRDETILEVTIDDGGFIEGLDADRSSIVVTTERHLEGELAGVAFEAIDPRRKPEPRAHTLTVSTVDVTAGAPIAADVTVDGETESTTFKAGRAIAEFEVTDGTYAVSAVSDQGTWGYVGETEVEIDGAADHVSVRLAPDYPELDHADHAVKRVERDDSEAYVARGTVENDTDVVSPPFSVEVTFYDAELDPVATRQSRDGHLGLEVGPGESVDWESEPLTEDDDGFEDVDPESYDIVLRGGAEGLPFSELRVRDGGGEPAAPSTIITVVDAETGEPVEGAEVFIGSADGDPDDAVEFTFTTDADGRVEENVEIGNFIVVIWAEGYRDHTGEVGLEHEYHAELEPKDRTHRLRLETENEDADGDPIPTTIFIVEDEDGEIVFESEGTGSTEVELETGEYEVSATASILSDVFFIHQDETPRTVELDGDETLTFVGGQRPIEGADERSLTVEVVDPDGEPVEGQPVLVGTPGEPDEFHTDESGRVVRRFGPPHADAFMLEVIVADQHRTVTLDDRDPHQTERFVVAGKDDGDDSRTSIRFVFDRVHALFA